MLSKSRYTRGINCHKSLWLYVHKKVEQKINEATQAIFKRGTSVGELAQQYFPDGKIAVLEDFPGYESAKRTQDFIIQGIETIYEATFIYDDTLVAVDILQKENGKWYLYEVKSTNSTKPEHIKDVAVQYYVLAGSGLPLADAFLMHFNRDYVRRGAIDINKLFKADSILKKVLLLQTEVKETIPVLSEMLKGEEPVISMGNQCTDPYLCDFCEYCISLVPPVKQKTAKLSSKPEIDVIEVRKYVESIQYPLAFLDFETIMPGVPMFNESRPYQQLPFQYSLHIQDSKDSDIKHYSYLAESNPAIDPRIGLIEQMIEQTKKSKTILVYWIAFERSRINEMMRDFPQYKPALESIVKRLVDLIIPFYYDYYRTETMEGSSSIKKVLPALCPELSYNDLEIGEGRAASNLFLDLYYCTDEETIAKTRKNLLEYCHLDTLAMVKIFEILKKV